LLFIVRSASASDDEPVRYAIHWEAPDTCTGQRDMQKQVEARLGREAGEGTPELLVVAHVTREPSGFVAELSLRTAAGDLVGTRRVHSTGGTCASLDVPASVIVAMMVNIRRKELDLYVPPVAPQPPAPPVSTPASPAPIPPAATASAWRPEVGILGDAWFGIYPAVAAGATGRLGIVHASGIAVAIEASMWGGAPAGATAGGRIDSWGAHAALSARWILRFRILDVAPRVAFYGGVAEVSASGYDVNESSSRAFFAAGAGLEIGHQVGPLHLFVLPEADLPLLWDRLDVRTPAGAVATAYDASHIAARFSLGVERVFRDRKDVQR
jgi:hypothetical protein